MINTDKLPVLILGGDHPYKQWYGTNGSDGLAQMYLDRGITPYLAINTDDTDGPGSSADLMSWKECLELQKRGVEFVAHGYWHVNNWSRINTGIKVQYIGSNASATIHVTGTVSNGIFTSDTLTCTSTTPSSDTVSSSFSTDTTLSAVKATIEASGKWRVTLDPILTGNEPSTCLLGLTAARTVTSGGVETSNNTYLCAGGGIYLSYVSSGNPPTLGNHAVVRRNASKSLTIFLDGVQQYSHTAADSSGSMSTIVSQISSLFNSEYTCKLCDNGKAESSGKPSYMVGDELEVNLSQINYMEFGSKPVVLEAGLPQEYIIYRHMEKVRVDAYENHGLKLKHFAQSGGGFYEWLAKYPQYGIFRGNSLWRSTTPFPIRQDKLTNFIPHRTVTNASGTSGPYYVENLLALVDAMCNYKTEQTLEPWVVCLLMHKVIPDGTSGYVLTTTKTTDADQKEYDWVTFLDYVKKHVDAGLLKTSTFDQLYNTTTRNAPKNLWFNPTLANAGSSRVPSAGNNDGGYWIPGTYVSRGSNISSLSVSNNKLAYTASSTSASEILQQDIAVEPGKSYEASCLLENVSYTYNANTGLQWGLVGNHGNVDKLINNATTNWKITGPQKFQTGVVSLRFTVPPLKGPTTAFVRASSMQSVTASNSGGDLLLTYANDWPNLAPISFYASTLPGNISANTTYYLVRQSATTAKVSTSSSGTPLIAYSSAGATVVGQATVPPTTYDMSINKNIKLNLLSIGATGDIDCSGVSAAATTAVEIANKINTAIAADSTYASKKEYHNIATVVNGYLTLSIPVLGTDQASVLSVAAGSTASAVAAIFGNATVSGWPQLVGMQTSENFTLRLALRTTLQGSSLISNISLKEVGTLW